MKLRKITKRKGSEKRRYDDSCGTAHALELIGDRWALLVMRELMLGPRRFSQLRADLPGISANVLAQRLGDLERTGLLERLKLPPPASMQVYGLTRWGYEAEPITQALGRWAARSPHHDPSLRISGVSLLLSFRTLLDRERAKGLDAVVGFRFGEDVYRGHLTERGIEIAREDPGDADVVFAGSVASLGAAVHGGVPLAALVREGRLAVEGDRKLAERFTRLFPLPEKISDRQRARAEVR